MGVINRVLDPEPVADLAAYEAGEGGRGLYAARHRRPAEIIDVVERSGLRGRGGAGFPTGRKWRTVAGYGSPVQTTPVVVNAAEGEPGTFKDRELLRRNPYRVLEGALIAALAVGSRSVIVATKASYSREIERLHVAADEMQAAGWLDGVEVLVIEGPSSYLYGEETALLEVLEGRPPFPRVTPPYRRGIDAGDPGGRSAAARGLATGADRGAPALVDNVETLANVPGILAHGWEWYRTVGTESSPGTLVCTVTGATVRHGIAEFPLGTTLREVIETIGGGARPGRRLRGVLPGVSAALVPESSFDTPLTHDAMAALGSGLGSGGYLVVDDATDLVEVARGVSRFLAVESCGQCVPCKDDGLAIADLLGAPSRGEALDEAGLRRRLATVADGARCALAGQQERVVGSLLDVIASHGAVETPVADPERFVVAPLVDISSEAAVLDAEEQAKRPDWTYEGAGEDSGAWPVQRLADQPVEIIATGEEEQAPDRRGSGAVPDPYGPLRDIHRTLQSAATAMRRASDGDRPAAAARLGTELSRHLQICRNVLFPMVVRTAPEEGDDVVWYPDSHERRALHLLDRVESAGAGASSQLVDDVAADVERVIAEIERRVFPLLDDRLDEDGRMELASALAEADETAPAPTAR
jgi:NADH-quinone oxidoreductase subunit F